MKYINPLNGNEYDTSKQYVAEQARRGGHQNVKMTIPTLDTSAEEFLAAMHHATYEALRTVKMDFTITKDSNTDPNKDGIVIHWDVGEMPSQFMFHLITTALGEVYKDTRYNLLRFTRGEGPVNKN